MDIVEKIKKHPRSQVARAYRLGKSEANGFLPLAKLFIRYLLLKDRGMLRSHKENMEMTKIREQLKFLTK